MDVVLAYSGGLDTSAAIVWLKKVRAASKIIAVLVDVGQDENLDALEIRARRLGADIVERVDVQKELCEHGIAPMLRVGATYEKKYLLGTAVSRPFIADAMVKAAAKYKAQYICHGATGKGNDYLRFETRIFSQNPALKIISPWREWQLGGRDEALAFLQESGVVFEMSQFDYSIDANLWHTSFEGGSLEELSNPIPLELLSRMSQAAEVKVTLDWKNGLPTALNGKEMSLQEIILQLNASLENSGFGWLDLVETRTNGLKSRGIYHTPAGSLLYAARDALTSCFFPGPTLAWIEDNAVLYGKLLYEGLAHHPLVKAIDASMTSLFQGTSGEVTLMVKGAQLIVCSRQAFPNHFVPSLGGFGNMQAWDPSVSQALVHLHQLKWNALPFQYQAGGSK
jgi:argininosuccinate synthase